MAVNKLILDFRSEVLSPEDGRSEFLRGVSTYLQVHMEVRLRKPSLTAHLLLRHLYLSAEFLLAVLFKMQSLAHFRVPFLDCPQFFSFILHKTLSYDTSNALLFPFLYPPQELSE
jgi:hypothetical protein